MKIVAGIILIPFWFAADTAPSDSVWERLGTAGIVAVVLSAWLVIERRRGDKLQAKVDELTADAMNRERERSERLALSLHDAAETLRDVKTGMFAAMERVTAPRDQATDVTLRRLENVIDALNDEREARPQFRDRPDGT